MGRDGTGGEDEDIISRLNRMGKQELAEAEAYFEQLSTDYDKRVGEMLTGKLCEICNTQLYSDPGPHEVSSHVLDHPRNKC